LDYRAALRERSGVGEYAHHLAKALLSAFPPSTHGQRTGKAVRRDRGLDLMLFSSSWKDRLSDAAELAGADLVDRRVPGRVLNLAWHRLGWPSAESLTGRAFDVAHSLHPLLMPTSRAAQVVTIHDLYFLDYPERTRGEIRRDYPALARDHARRADGIVVISQFTARQVERHFDVDPDRISVCPPWTARETPPKDGYILFIGTLESRKNVGGLLDAYEQLVARRRDMPRLIIAGKALDEARPWLERIARPPLAGRVQHIGYVNAADRRAVYEGARLVVQPSFDEGFGIPVLEAMTVGVPVVAADRGALPEVLGDAGPLVDPETAAAIAAAIERLVDDEPFAASCVAKGIARARQFSWAVMARRVYEAYERAIERRCA
jgi:glycosyltransferase involved in cell wall biosynthesis